MFAKEIEAMFCKGKIKTEIYIEGMHCMHCAGAVEKALKAVNGISSAKVELEAKKATVTSKDEINVSEIKQVIDELGFSVVDVVKL